MHASLLPSCHSDSSFLTKLLILLWGGSFCSQIYHEDKSHAIGIDLSTSLM